MKQNSLFKTEYNKANSIDIKSDLDIYDECYFSYLDILKEKEVEVTSKVYSDCKCVSSVNFSAYYDKCDKCEGKGKISLNGNDVTCNHCKGEGKIVKEVCPLCDGEGKVIKKGKVLVKLDRNLKDNDIITVKGKGKISKEVKGDLFIKVIIHDRDCFEIKNKDVYDRRMVDFSKDDINKGASKPIETIRGVVKVSSKGEEEKEVVKLEGEGINGGDFYVCLNNELAKIKGKDVYKNVIVNRDMLGFYIDKNELNSDKKCLSVYYYKKIDENNYDYIDLKEANNFKIVKLKEKGLEGKNGGVSGDLYLRVYFDDEFACNKDRLYHKPIKLNKYEIIEGKKIVEFNKDKITLTFPKNLEKQCEIEVKDYGFMIDKNEFDYAIFLVNPFEYDCYNVSVKVNKKDKVVYLKNYKKYFGEIVSFNYNNGLKVEINKKKYNFIVNDENGNKVLVNIIK